MHQVLLVVVLVEFNKRVADPADLMLNGEPIIISLALLVLFYLNFDCTVIEPPVFHNLHVFDGWVEEGRPERATV